MERMKIRKILLVLTAILVIVGSISILYIFQNSPYEKQYFEKSGIKGGLRYYYSDLVKQIGVANKELIKETSDHGIWTEYSYDGFIVSCWKSIGSQKNEVMNVKITSKNTRFGKSSIGIGSKRLEVEQAYRKVNRIKDSQELGFIDGDVWIDFIFDSNNQVVEMHIYYGP